ncbi:DUF364 domain-containing protein [Acidianus manzaensis]|uniref:Heavy-metal chelation domain-containing protein n=1 Tax=Acidianus manzaensis TaxID=282676 RepID=A0A1W6JYG1_9CREN|nr:DUF364 domain-containing protein [Acidianus manzaensis]ARM75303.1 hypothetical protein B6F84_04150 [Acidianus manzaensis]
MKSKVIDYLISYAKENDSSINSVNIGVTWTCVLSKYCGVAITYPMTSYDSDVRDFGSLEEKRVSELAKYLGSWNLLEASVGLAAINSVIQPHGNVEGNGLDIALELGKNKKIVMIGKFPGIEKFKEISREFIVLELNPFLLDYRNNILPSTASESVISNADIVIITASAIINKSIDRLLQLAKMANAYTILLGPSTPMLDAMLDFGIDMLAGMKVNRPQSFIKKISQGCGMISPNKLNGDVSYIVLT